MDPLEGGGWPTEVLIVDDEPVVLSMFQSLFKKIGIDVDAAKTGEEALELMAHRQYACMLVDKNLPGVGGLEVIRIAVQRQPQCACIIMTAYASTESAVEALRLGAADYLTKPFDNISLVAEKIRKVARHHRADFTAKVLGRRLQNLRGELDQRATELNQLQQQVTLLEGIVASQPGTTTRLPRIEQALKSTSALAREVLLHTEALVHVLRASPLEDHDRRKVDAVADAVAQLDVHLTALDYLEH